MGEDEHGSLFGEVRRVIADAVQAGLAPSVVDGQLRFSGKLESAPEALKARLRRFRLQVTAELDRPRFSIRSGSGATVVLPNYWMGWWQEMRVDQVVPNLIHIAWRVRGTGCADRFREAIAAVTAQHALLRARIVDCEDGLLRIKFDRDCAFERPAAAFSSRTEDSSVPDGTVQMVNAMVWMPAKDGHVFRAFVVDVSQSEVICGFVLHHLVADFYAGHLVAREIWRKVSVNAEGVGDSGARWLSYADYVLARSQWEGGAAARHRLTYWVGHLKGACPANALSKGTDASASGVAPLLSIHFTLTQEIRARLAAVTAAGGATVAQVLLAAKFMALSTVLRKADLTLAVIVSGRDDPHLLRFIGNTADCLPVRLNVDKKQSFWHLLEELQFVYGLACRYRVKWELVLDALGRSGAKIVAPTFNFVSARALTLAQRTNMVSAATEGLEIIRLRTPPERGSVGWHTNHAMNLFDNGRVVAGHVKYMPLNTDGSVMQEFVQRYVSCVHRIVERPYDTVEALVQ